MRVPITYNYHEQDPVTVTTTLAVIVAWERKFKRKASSLATEAGVEDLAFLAWEASKAAKVVVPVTFDDFVAKLEAIEVGADEPAFPTPAAAGGTD